MASESKADCIDLTQDEEASKPKKMKQMRLPFATIDKNAAIAKMEQEVKKVSEESKKRKLSSESSDVETISIGSPSTPKVKVESAKKKAKKEAVVVKENKKETPKAENKKETPKAVEKIEAPKASPVKKEVSKENASSNLQTEEDEVMEVPMEVDAKKVEVQAPKESPQIVDTIAKTPDAKPRPASNSSTEKSATKKMTPKQLARKAEFDKKREEKERLKEEARLAREKEKEKREEEKRQKEAQKEQEKLEKERQRLKEKEEKERVKKEKEEERLQKKKEKEEQKEQEKLKKEEMSKKKQDEKDEKERQEKAKNEKAKKSFANFFVKKEVSKPQEISNVSNNGLNKFRVKADMKLAPLHRYSKEDFVPSKFDSLFCGKPTPKSELYLQNLHHGKHKPKKQGRTWPYTRKSDEDDVEIIEEDGDSDIGEEITENEEKKKEVIVGKVYKKAKLLQFEENQRPAYFGTWNKKSAKVKARRPFGMDSDVFDYEYDSDDDWEEEEQGESLSDEEKDKEEDEKDAEDEVEDDDGFFVGHGVLDKDELKGAEDDEDAFDEELEMKKQKLKAQQFEEEYKKKKPTKLKPRVFGCFWNDPNDNKDTELKIAYDQLIKILTPFKAVVLTSGGLIPTSLSHPKKEEEKSPDNAESKKVKPLKQVPEETMPNLIRLVHANTNNKIFLAKEFHEFWSKNNQVPLSKGKILAKIQEIAEYKKCEALDRKCWMVKDDVLKSYKMTNVEVPNAWEYTLERPNKSANTTPSTPMTPTASAVKTDPETTPKADKSGPSKAVTPSLLITKFTKVLSEEERLKAMNSSPKPTAVNKPVNVLTPKRRIQPTLVDLTKQ